MDKIEDSKSSSQSNTSLLVQNVTWRTIVTGTKFHVRHNNSEMGQKPLKALQDPQNEGRLYPVCFPFWSVDCVGF